MDSKQMRLFEGPDNAPNQQATGGTGDVEGGVMDLLSRLAVQRTLTEHLLERIVDYKNLKEAYEQVRRNDGSAGVDGMLRVSDKSTERLKGKIREICQRNRGVKFEQVIAELNAAILGWTNYFRLASKWLSTMHQIDSWMRHKLRCYRLKQCGRKYTIFKML